MDAAPTPSDRSRPRRAAATGLALALVGLLSGCPEPDRPVGVPDGDRDRAASGDVGIGKNLLFISIDTLRRDAIGAYGSSRGATPAIDVFAESSVVFDGAWTHTPKTAPAHMSMFTSLPPSAHGVGNLNTTGAGRLSDSIRTLPEVLQDAGFATGGFTGGGNAKGSLGFDRGFDAFDDTGEPLYEKVRRAEPWIMEAEASGRPWFCFLHTYHVHDPYFPPPKYMERFVSGDYDGPILATKKAIRDAIEAGDDLAPDMQGHAKITWNYWFRVREKNPVDLAYLHDLYTAGVAHMDFILGAFLKRLMDAGIAEDTIIVLTTDHGEEFGEHGQVRHEQLWAELAHVPLMVMLPGKKYAGTRIAEPVRHLDLLPSLLELLDVEDVPLDQGGTPRLGRSWVEWLAAGGAQGEPVRSVIGEHRSGRDRPLDVLTIREGSLLLYDDAGRVDLFDRATDPLELVPLDRPDEVARLRDLLDRQREQFVALGATLGRGGAIELDAAQREQLEALGYLLDEGDE